MEKRENGASFSWIWETYKEGYSRIVTRRPENATWIKEVRKELGVPE